MNRAVSRALSPASALALLLSIPVAAFPQATAEQIRKDEARRVLPTCQSVHEVDAATGAFIQKTRLVPQAFSFDPLLVWTSDQPDSLMFVVMGNGKPMKYTGCFTLTLTADGQPVTVGRLEHDRAPDSPVEYIRTEIPWSEARKLAGARTIAYTICKDDYKADGEFVCDAKDLIGQAEAWKRQPAGKK